MDVYQTIRELTEERDRLDAVIAALEARLERERSVKKRAPARKRGRKSMDAAERLRVSERMRLYWEKRRNNSPTA